MGLEGVRENFVAALDDSQWGISINNFDNEVYKICLNFNMKGSNMKRLYQLLKTKDLAVYNTLEKLNLKPEFFAFRWLTLLLSQEFQLPGEFKKIIYTRENLFKLAFQIRCHLFMGFVVF